MEYAALDLPDHPRLVENITYFARALRRAGLPVGTGRVIDAIRAIAAAGFTNRLDFFYALRSSLITKPEHRDIFAQVFRLYWRDPRYLEQMMSLLLPSMRGTQEQRVAKAAEKRAAEALLDGAAQKETAIEPEGEDFELEIDASKTASAKERLKTLDFEQMSLEEMAEAKRMIARLEMPVRPLRSRRTKPGHSGKVDPRHSFREMMRTGGEMRKLYHRQQAKRWPALVVLCDISGSMSQYSRMVLHFLHAVANQKGAGWADVHGFTFGTRLTNITHTMKTKDVDAALEAVGKEAQDWIGGTRIGDCLDRFNRDWSRRVMGRGAIVLLITDGLDTGEAALLHQASERLRLSANRVIWINPLLRWEGFRATAQGIRTLLPNVDAFCAGHTIHSLETLAEVIASARDTGKKTAVLSRR